MTKLRSVRLTFFCIAVLNVATLTGCLGERQSTVYTEYGKIRGKSAGTSVNGVSVLADILRDQGHSVARYGRLSPRIERYDTLIWFPENKNCPSDEAVEYLEQWLNNGYRRTLIYVGYDFAGEIDFYRQTVAQAKGEQKERVMRALAEAQMQDDRKRYHDNSDNWRIAFAGGRPNDTSCRWFDLEVEQRELCNDLDGPLTENLSTKSMSSLQTQAWLVPRESYLDSHPGRKLETLLDADDRPFAFRYYEEPPDPDLYWASENRLVFVTNAGFLTNYALIETENRQLANNLIEQIEPYSDVLFLESGTDGIEISESDYDAHNTWAWITKKPLCYMVPHVLAWGVLFCFTFYPIFGRPKQTVNTRNRSFGDHIGALARLSSRHLTLSTARLKVRKYLNTDDGTSTKQSNVSKSSEDRVSR